MVVDFPTTEAAISTRYGNRPQTLPEALPPAWLLPPNQCPAKDFWKILGLSVDSADYFDRMQLIGMPTICRPPIISAFSTQKRSVLMLEREEMLCYSLGVAMRRVSKLYADALADHDITPPQLFVLTCLQEQDGRRVKELADQVCLDASSLTGLLDRTERIGLVERRPDPDDRRALRIHLTDAGRTRLTDLVPVIEKLTERVHEDFFEGYSREQVELFLKMLRQAQEVIA